MIWWPHHPFGYHVTGIHVTFTNHVTIHTLMSHWFIVRSVSRDIPDLSGLGRFIKGHIIELFTGRWIDNLHCTSVTTYFGSPIVIAIQVNLKLRLRNLLNHWNDPTMTKYVRQDPFDNFLKTIFRKKLRVFDAKHKKTNFMRRWLSEICSDLFKNLIENIRRFKWSYYRGCSRNGSLLPYLVFVTLLCSLFDT